MMIHMMLIRYIFQYYRETNAEIQVFKTNNKILLGFQLDFMIWKDICINESKRF